MSFAARQGMGRKKMRREINVSNKKIEGKITNRRKSWRQKDLKH